jgi:hypothetical protein
MSTIGYRWARVVAVLLFVVVLAAERVAGAADGPMPPCDAASLPAYALPNETPTVQIWHAAELKDLGWVPPPCLRWDGPTDLVVAVAGSFRSTASAGELLGRLGAISAYPLIQYWSASSKAWRPIADRAWAVDDPRRRRPRADFTAADLSASSPLYYAEEDSRTGTVIYRMQSMSSTPNRAVLAIENTSSIRFYFLRLFDPGALQTVLFLERLSPVTWGLYEVTRTGTGASIFAGGHEESYVNRAVAVFWYLAKHADP